ncbi:hypothetical protein BJ742DRAFT_175485 [Cladochytrium replicatum]|nr:hypothetical protein BJ742DRAFT_175485 [Cladochytrium replicatum]
MATEVRFTREELELYSRGRQFDRRGILIPSPRKSPSFGVETINGYRSSRHTSSSSSPTTPSTPQNRLSAPPALFSAFSPIPKAGNGHVPSLETLGEDPEDEEDDEDDDRTVVNRRSNVVRERWSTSRVPTGAAGTGSGWSGSVFRNTTSGKVSRPSSLRRAAKADVESIAEVDEDVETEGEDVSGGGLQSVSGGDVAMENVDAKSSIARWLTENDYGHLVDTFAREEVDSWDVMATLNLEALRAMGFTVGTSLRLLVSIKKHLKATGMGQDSSSSSQSIDSVSVDELHSVVAEMVAQSLKDKVEEKGRKLRPQSMVDRLPWNSNPRSPPRNSSSSSSTTTTPSSPLQQRHRTSSARNLMLKPEVSTPPRSASVDQITRFVGGRSASRESNQTPSASSSRSGSPSRWGEKRRREGSPGKGATTGSTGGRSGASSSVGRFQNHP